jgi:hypothetical protein
MNFILEENKLEGTGAWKLTKPSIKGEIEGFASKISLLPGQALSFYVRTASPEFSMDFFRMGWYSGLGGRLMHSVSSIQAQTQPAPEIDSRNMVECHWAPCLDFQIPESWCSGVYLCKLTARPDLFESYIVFTVKQAAVQPADYLFQLSCNTYQAYNTWGNYSLYDAIGSKAPDPYKDRARAVSFNRPFQEGHGAGQFFRWEYQLLRWLERNGTSLAYCSNHDVHANKTVFNQAKAFLSVGHDEYWSKEMYDHLEEALEKGNMGVGFLGANAIYWQIRYEDSFNGHNRTMVCYKCDRHNPYKLDPVYETNPALVTARFRDFNINRPEQKIVGQMYAGWFTAKEPNQNLSFIKTDHWLFDGTGITKEDTFKKLIGYEFDGIWDGFPKPENLVVLGHSPVTRNETVLGDGRNYSNVTLYTKANGNSVFAAGTCSWNWALDNYSHEEEGLVSEKVQAFTLQVLNFLSKKEIRAGTHLSTAAEQRSLNELNKKKANASRIRKAEFAPYTWWICALVGLGIGLANSDNVLAFIGFVSGAVIGRVAGLYIDQKRTS